jgi:hypothetical protein
MSDPRKKRFALDPFQALAEGRGSCFADRVTVDGKPVGFIYRELPDDDIDSGWRFFSGEDTQEYADDPANFRHLRCQHHRKLRPGHHRISRCAGVLRV